MPSFTPAGRCLVTGASGFIGRHLVRALRTGGTTVRTLSRQGPDAFPADVDVVRADLAAADVALDSALADCDVVFHCAGELTDASVMRALHVDGTRRLVAAAERVSEQRGAPIHFIQLSSVGAYGPPSRPGETRVVTEATPTRPVGEYERTKTLGDEIVTAASARGVITTTILRPSNVFGRDMSNGSVRALAGMVRRGLFFYIGPAGAIATYIHVDDVVDALLACATDGCAQGQLFNLSNDCPLHEVIDAFADAQQVRRPTLRLPGPPVLLAATLASAVGVRVLTPQRIGALVGRTRYPTDRIREVRGFAPTRDVPKTIVEVIRAA
jgi:nucleoside-diphosphate-sugar epimerase